MRIRSSRLPSGYREVEYLETSSSSIAYINPNYKFTSNIVDIEVIATTTKTGKEMCLAGASSALEVGYSSTVGRLIAYSSGKTTLAYTGQTTIYNTDKHKFHFWQTASTKYFQVCIM